MSDREIYVLSQPEMELWTRLQEGPIYLDDISEPEIVESLRTARMIEIVNPVKSKEGAPKVLVIEPHSDDAALSIGATLWERRNENKFTILTMASTSNYTSCFELSRDQFNRINITDIRTKEGIIFASHLGAEYVAAGMNEATLRYSNHDWSLDFFKSHKVPVAVATNRMPDGQILDSWVAWLSTFLSKNHFDEIWAPLGIGKHADHDLTRNCALICAIDQGIKLRAYHDVPYLSKYPEHRKEILRSLTDNGAKIVPGAFDIDKDFKKKCDLLEVYASQFKVDAIRPGVEMSSKIDSPRCCQEFIDEIVVRPRFVSKDAIRRELSIHKFEIEVAREKIGNLLPGAENIKRMPLLFISASGNWRGDLDCLRCTFTNCAFTIYAGPKIVAEFECLVDDKVKVVELKFGMVSWIFVGVREFFAKYRMIISGEALEKARRLRVIWPFGKTEIFSEMDHVFQVLSDESQTG